MKNPEFPDGVVLRTLKVGDVEAFRDLRLEYFSAHPSAFSSSFEEEESQPLSYFEERLTNSLVAGAWAQELLVGTGGLAVRQRAKLRHKAELWGMFVRPEWRGRGLARALLHYLIGHAPPGIEEIVLEVPASSASALALYRSEGFEEYGMEPRALRTAEGYHDEILMRLVLTRAK